MRKNTFQSGQTLLEVVVVTGLIALTLVTFVSALNYSLSNTQFSTNKTIATKYASDAIEWVRISRGNRNWTDFTIVPEDIYCINDDLSELNWPPANTTCPPTLPTIDDRYDIFIRTITFRYNSGESLGVHVEVSWPQSDQTRKVETDTIFTKWE